MRGIWAGGAEDSGRGSSGTDKVKVLIDKLRDEVQEEEVGGMAELMTETKGAG